MSLTSSAQIGRSDINDENILLTNPSFEDKPHSGAGGSRVIGWFDCGAEMFPGETPPDIHPASVGIEPYFGVTQKAQEGKTFLGMVVRDNNAWESVSQRLIKPLLPGQCYGFSIYLCRSTTYVSATKVNQLKMQPFTNPCQLRIWGGNTFCGRTELLATSSIVINDRWIRYQFKFSPKARVNYITFEAFYQTGTLFQYNGNLLLDNASPIFPVQCDEKMANVEKKDTPLLKQKPLQAKPLPLKTEPPIVPKPVEESLAKVNSKDLKEGQIMRLDKLFFAADSSSISQKAAPVLQEVVSFMKNNPNLVIEIGGHTNDVPPDEYCDRLSSARAKSVYEFLIRNGIEQTRLQYKGYGKRQPYVTNKTVEGRKKNQRVEIKILSLNG